MLGFHRSRTQPVVEAPRPTKQRPAPRQQEDDLSQLLAFLPICAPCLLPPEFAYRLPGANSTVTAAHDPYLLSMLVFQLRRRRGREILFGRILTHLLRAAYFGTKSGLQLAIHDAARLVILSGLRENLQQEVDLGEVELSVLLEEGQVTGLTHGRECAFGQWVL